jgi:dTDP-4-amino-4,6-dideoxygalactose transaminase
MSQEKSSISSNRGIDEQILLSTPHMRDAARDVEEAFRTNWIVPLGPNVDAFENELAEYLRPIMSSSLRT